jgi:ABC-2 type transport system ATP-binding protein
MGARPGRRAAGWNGAARPPIRVGTSAWNARRSAVIRVEGLTKSYGDRVVVENISFEVGRGEIVGFLGPNGAGKTTTMRVVTGYLKPSTGTVVIADRDMLADPLAARRHVGYLPEQPPLYLDMTPRAYLRYAGRLRGLDRLRARARAEEVAALCGIGEYLDTAMRKLSKGYRQRVGLAQAIVHEPEVLILDEPTSGIDPIQIAETKALIRTLGRNCTIMLSTHVLSDVSALCERVIILQAGRIVAEDRIDTLSSLLDGAKRLRLQVDGPAEAVTAALGGITSLRQVSYEAPFHLVTFDASDEPRAAIARVLFDGGWTLLVMEPVQTSLETIFLSATSAGASKA